MSITSHPPSISIVKYDNTYGTIAGNNDVKIIDPERKNYNIDHENRVLLVRNPKTATTSIREAWDKPITRVDYEQALKFNRYYTIMFVREPADRFISAVSQFWPRKKPLEIIKRIRDADPFTINKHIRPQWTFKDGLRIDYLGKFEHLKRCWQDIQDMYGFADLPVRNKLKDDRRKTLTIGERKIVEEIYARDYEEFGY